MMAMGQYLRELRDKRDLSLREFAKKLGCSAAFVSDVELGRRYPSEDVLSNMARILGVTVADLKSHDVRAPIEEIKRVTANDPRYAVAFRTIIDSGVTPDQLMRLAKQSHDEGLAKKKK
jgi:transcriptional regulator with XRE-family HTH domain